MLSVSSAHATRGRCCRNHHAAPPPTSTFCRGGVTPVTEHPNASRLAHHQFTGIAQGHISPCAEGGLSIRPASTCLCHLTRGPPAPPT